jgi:hypothetical protein
MQKSKSNKIIVHSYVHREVYKLLENDSKKCSLPSVSRTIRDIIYKHYNYNNETKSKN